jgi:hypothetical protein
VLASDHSQTNQCWFFQKLKNLFIKIFKNSRKKWMHGTRGYVKHLFWTIVEELIGFRWRAQQNIGAMQSKKYFSVLHPRFAPVVVVAEAQIILKV